ncbi:MAG: hypothetical protein VX257_10965 [Planctomycetota bacterium]|nr:hypothetical protein [Planctomycetota bacterium]
MMYPLLPVRSGFGANPRGFVMTRHWNKLPFVATALLFCPLVLSATGLAEADQPTAVPENAVDLFDAMDNGDIEARLIVNDIQNARLIVRNMTKQPMTIKLPEAIAAIPVLAQQAGGGGGGGGGFFNVPPEKVAKQDLNFLCLEHGTPDPKSTWTYRIGRIEEVTSDPRVVEIFKGLDHGKFGHEAAQAAVWHLQNDMQWEQLAAKQRRRLVGGNEPVFTRTQIRQAMNIVAYVKKIAEKSEKSESLAN